MEKYTKVGEVALRDPLNPERVFPAIPLYTLIETRCGSAEEELTCGDPAREDTTEAEEEMLREGGLMFVRKFREYEKACRKKNIKI